MRDRLLLTALRLRDPRALAALHDAYAERLYAYCWFRLHSRGAAGLALRDTFMRAAAHAHELPRRTGIAPWLYGIARAECARRRLPGIARPDVRLAAHDRDDAAARLVAWRAVAALPPLSRELLDLRHRHGLAPKDVAAVVGRPVRDVAKLLRGGRALLEAALAAEELAGDGPLPRHSCECPRCRRSISVAKVYGLLPCPAPPRSSRSQILRSLTDPALAQYRLLASLRDPAPRRRPAMAVAAVLVAATVGGSSWLADLDDHPHLRGPAPTPALDANPVTDSPPAIRPTVRPAGLE